MRKSLDDEEMRTVISLGKKNWRQRGMNRGKIKKLMKEKKWY